MSRRPSLLSTKSYRLTGKQLEEKKNEYFIEDHLVSIYELEKKYATSTTKGLSVKEARERRLRDGPNCLADPPSKSKLLLLAKFIFCGFSALLWAAVVMSGVMFVILQMQHHDKAAEHLYFCVVVSLVIFASGFFAYYQESANVAAINSFKKLTPKHATVIREGLLFIISSEDVVLGDLVQLKAGEWIPADLRLVVCQGLKVDNSSITGESHPVSRSVNQSDPVPLESPNMAFFTTCVIEGSGQGIVVRRGDASFIGGIAELTSNLEKGETPLSKEINRFLKFITIMAVLIGFGFFSMCLVYNYDFFTSFFYLIALIIANVPEGLPVTLTACLTLTSKRMASKNCMVKKLEAIETLGCTSVICSDKTGTLTQNKMKVVRLFYDNQSYYVLAGPESIDPDNEAYKALCQIAILCSQATFLPEDEYLSLEEKRIDGDASEAAILKCMEELIGSTDYKRKENPKVFEIPFNSVNKYQVSIHRIKDEYVLLMKGAPERIVDRCTDIMRFDKTEPFTKDLKRGIFKAIDTMGNKGERVLALADLVLPSDTYHKAYVFDAETKNFPLTGLTFVGLVAMMDPPKPSVPDAVSKCKSAGIKVIMVTGDHPVTASAIAKQVGIISPGSVTPYDIALKRDIAVSMVTEKEMSMCTAAVFTGQDLREMSSSELQNNMLQYKEIVFARTSPQQKLKIVENFQKLGHVVAATGDGVNDSPALKKADIGIAMGIAGTEVSKDAADMILLDDNFSSIVVGIEEGRLIFDNLKKSIAYLLTSNVPEILPFVAMVFFNFPPVIGVLAVVMIDIGTDLWPAVSLAYERAEADIMTRRPRDPFYDKLVNYKLIFLTYAQIGVIQACGAFSCYFLCMMEHGFFYEDLIGLRPDWMNPSKNVTDSYGQIWTYTERKILTYRCYSSYFMSMVMTQIADLIICKTRRLSLCQQGMTNHVLNVGIFLQIALAVVAVYCPGVNTFLEFQPVDLSVLLPSVPFSILVIVYDEARRYLIRKYPGGVVDVETYY